MHVTVCVCTRDRGDGLARTLRSIANSHHGDFDIVIVDQSAADDTARSVQGIVERATGIAYIRSPTVGISAARNIAIQHSRGPIIAFTDDDCEVSPEWLGILVKYFHKYPDVGLIFGEVRAGPHDSGQGFIPTYAVPHLKWVSTPWLKWREGGIGANMALRHQVLRAVGPFDQVLGTGAPLYTCEDGDMTYRVLKAGYSVLSVTDAYVVHHGFRTWEEGQKLMFRTGLGVGAAYMKHLRLGDLAVLPTLVYEWVRCISWMRLLRLQSHIGLRRFLAYAQGVAISFRYGINRRERIYIPRKVPRTVPIIDCQSPSHPVASKTREA